MLHLLVAAALAGDLSADATGRFVSDQARPVIDAELAAAVERSAGSVSFVYRMIARPRLTEQATACPAYETSLQGEVFTVKCDGKEPFSATIGDKKPWTGPDGEPLTMSLSRTGRSIQLEFAGETGGKRWTYTFPEAGGLEVQHEVYSPYLGESMRWLLTFDRAS